MSETSGRADPLRGHLTWYGADVPGLPRPKGLAGWWRVVRRGVPAILILLIGVILILPIRGVEKLFHGPRRPWTGPFVRHICRLVLFSIGLGWRCEGTAIKGPGAIVANHSSWLDVLTMNAALPVFFVAKAEVQKWPGINILTAVTNTHFVIRDPRYARQQAGELSHRIRAGHRLLFFPEGTSTDGRRVLGFKPTLFQGFLAPELPDGLAVQPMSVAYHAPAGQDDRFYGWWGGMSLGDHLLAVLSAPYQGRAEVILHPPVPVAGETRKTLAAKTCETVRRGLDAALAEADNQN